MKQQIKNFTSLSWPLVIILVVILSGCSASRRARTSPTVTSSGAVTSTPDIVSKVTIKNKVAPRVILTKNIYPDQIVSFAKTLIGINYKYGSMDVNKGFDCSGFINYVFHHFDISVPRTTTEFTNAGKEVPARESRPGDLILFTGTDPNSGVVGHMGIITENNNGDIRFIHSSTSKGVVISGMNSYFLPRFVKVNRVFPDDKFSDY